MALSDLDIKKEYRNLQCDVIKDFYIPILKEAVIYKRAVGFFSSSALYEIAIGLKALVENNGKIQLIASPKLTEDDVKAIKLGYELREDIIGRALLRDLPEKPTNEEQKRLNLLANLIAENILDIKIAFKVDADSAGIYHEKMGVVGDVYGNKLAFTGSMNETYSGLLLNYEAIDVFRSWCSLDEADRVNIKEAAFDSLWNNCDAAMDVVEFPKITKDKLSQYKIETTKEIFRNEFTEQLMSHANSFFSIPKGKELYKYQIEAIDKWEEQGFRGIFDMATGTGKTYTGLGALARLSEKCENKLAVVIVCPYQHLVEQWVEDIKLFGVDPLICYSRYDYKKKLKHLIEDYNFKVIENFCLITTNATFITDDMQNAINKIKGKMCIVVDEAHNFGAKRQIACMNEKIDYRLALSATLERHHDEYGTQRLYDYFGDKCIEYTLAQAIAEDKLTRYYYYPIPVSLTDDELKKYISITDRVVNILRKVPIGDDIPESAERLLIERARIIAGASNKLAALKEAILPYIHKNNILVYCGATKYSKHDAIDSPEAEDMRQIDAVTSLLGNELHMTVTKFTAAEDSKQRELIKSEFSNCNIQALVAIKCLDEGMNIPGINTAFILASSTNPKEYIQRRGRVLRKAPGKEYAVIFDFVTTPKPLDDNSGVMALQSELSLVRREVERMREFQELSENPSDTSKLINQLIDKYNLYYLGEDYGRI
jgi:superfamily II DNA or RNA helicase